jgi:hypothetical protein
LARPKRRSTVDVIIFCPSSSTLCMTARSVDAPSRVPLVAARKMASGPPLRSMTLSSASMRLKPARV